MIIFENVTKMYDGNIGIENVTVKIDKGDFVFLVGPSGAGKSTFVKLILKKWTETRSEAESRPMISSIRSSFDTSSSMGKFDSKPPSTTL